MSRRALKRGQIGVNQAVRILLVDDHAILLDTLRRQLESDPAIKVVGTASDPVQALEMAKSRLPGVVLLDIQLGESSGLDLIGAIREELPDVRIVVLSMFDQVMYRDRAFELGADAYVTKGVRFDHLRDVLVCPGLTPDRPDVQVWQRKASGLQRMTLTGRELQVVQKLAGGKREKEVADELGISVSSVGTYLKRAMDKTGMSVRAELFRHAGALGVNKPGSP